ncbi:MAG: hypothetical protein JSV22_14125 [Bacteroidales bacterium]|nr:MAG: hypothetical protein JSV22_14125 [Bacteroidales bacterium]
MEHLKFRRQFILINKNLNIPPGWKSTNLQAGKNNYFIYTHPDLEITESAGGNHKLILLGYIIDPFNPGLSNSEILKELSALNGFDDIVRKTGSYNGRYILICSNNDTFRIFNDAVGFREVYYHFNKELICCGTTPNIIAEYCNIEKDTDEAKNAFFNSSEFKGLGVWIGEVTIFKGINNLLPNHYLDINTRTSVRFYPYEPFKKTSLKEAVEIISRLLTGTLKGAALRYKLHQGLTSGWDTRLLLAASKDIKEQVHYYIYKMGHLNEKSKDIIISNKLANKFNLQFKMYDVPEVDNIDSKFKEIFHANNILARPAIMGAIYNAYINKFDDIYNVSGAYGNELIKISFGLPKNRAVNGKELASLIGYERFDYVISEIDKWYNNLKKEAGTLGYNPVGLFAWEQVYNHSAALAGSEQDIARDEIRPFNCRLLISTANSIHDKFRYKDHPNLYIDVMKKTWKEVMAYPVYRSGTSKYFLKKILRLLGIEQLVDRWYRSIK